MNVILAGSYSGQIKPWIVRQLNKLHLCGIRVFAGVASNQLKSINYRLSRTIAYAVCLQSVGNLDEKPFFRANLFLQLLCVELERKTPVLAKFFRDEIEVFRHCYRLAQNDGMFSNIKQSVNPFFTSYHRK